jgi:uncharacterized membrane protein
MQLALIIAISFHVLAAVFWAGTSFAVARMGGAGGERLFPSQMAAAAIVILTGGYLWRTLHDGATGPMEQFLGVAVASALVALLFQSIVAGPAVRKLSHGSIDEAAARSAIATANRIAAPLLAAATILMAGARYA